MIKIIKNSLVASILFVTLNSCNAQQNVNTTEITSPEGEKMLLGYQSKAELLKEPYAEWYKTEYDFYPVDKKSIEQLKTLNFNAYSLYVALGTWCGDSHREIPRLMKILDTLNFPENQMQILAVDRQKTAPNNEQKKYNIEFVPTVIVIKDGKEIGRIIENPSSGYLERDLLAIIKK